METLKILIGNDSPEQGMTWANSLKATGAYVVTRAANSIQLSDYITRNGLPSVIIMEAKMNGMNAPEFMDYIVTKMGALPAVIVVGDDSDSTLLEKAQKAGAFACFKKPVNIDTLCKTAVDAHNGENSSERALQRSNGFGTAAEREKLLEMTVTDIIHQIGVPAHIKGYHYLRRAIVLSVENSEMINCITKLLYPTVAADFKTTPSRVERAIRHAIETAWDRGDVDVLNSYFGYTIRSVRGKPTNSEFIALIADKLKLQLKNGAYAFK